MKKKHFELVKYLLLIIIGIFSFTMPKIYLNTFHIISCISVLILGIYFFIKNIKKHSFDIQAIISILIAILLFILIEKHSQLYLNVLPIAIGIYILIIGFAKLFTLLIYKKIPESKISYIISTIFHLIFAILFIVFPNHSLEGCTILTGFYLIINGIEKIYNLYNHKNYANIIKIPSILISIKPYRDLLKLNRKEFNNCDSLCDVEVLIHVRHSKRGMFGHADLVYKGNVYSYGNYDNSTYKILDAIGDGVLFKTERNKYIEFCKSYGKTLFCFGLKLNKEDQILLDERFNNIIENTHKWPKDNIIKDTYVDKLNHNLDITFFKFNEGYRQNYFFLNYNCVKFIQEIINPDMLDFKTIETPGMLYNYLENEFNKKNSIIKYKNIY